MTFYDRMGDHHYIAKLIEDEMNEIADKLFLETCNPGINYVLAPNHFLSPPNMKLSFCRVFLRDLLFQINTTILRNIRAYYITISNLISKFA